MCMLIKVENPYHQQGVYIHLLIFNLFAATTNDLQPDVVIVTLPLGTTPNSDTITITDFMAFDDTEPEDPENFVVLITGFTTPTLATVLIEDNDNGMMIMRTCFLLCVV